jgi:hypothetical protein
MAALTRKFKKIFAKDSANNGVFGSAAALAPATSTNPETIESLAAFLTGWEDATEGGLKLPTLEDMQGLKYDTDYHLAYIYQDGLQNYNSLTTYYINNYVREESTAKIWKSLVDNNTGNTLVEGANWSLVGNLSNIPAAPIVDASTTAKGIVELATNAEVTAGTDTTRPIVPSAFAASKFNALNLIATATAASSASIDFTGLNSDYSKYIIEIQDLIPATNGATVVGRVSIDNVNYITGTSYTSSCVSHNPAASWVSHNGATSGAGITSSAGGAGSYGLSNTSTKGLSGVIIIHNPSSLATHKKIEANGCYDNSAGDFTQFLSAASYEGGTNAIVAFRILLDTGNIASGSFKLFGVK